MFHRDLRNTVWLFEEVYYPPTAGDTPTPAYFNIRYNKRRSDYEGWRGWLWVGEREDSPFQLNCSSCMIKSVTDQYDKSVTLVFEAITASGHGIWETTTFNNGETWSEPVLVKTSSQNIIPKCAGDLPYAEEGNIWFDTSV